MFLTPDGKPFFGGTYFPKRSRYEPAGLRRVAAAGGAGLARAARTSDRAGRRAGSAARPDATGAARAGRAPRRLERRARKPQRGLRDASMRAFDTVNGGFGGAPKFPQPSTLDALLRHAVRGARRCRARRVLLTLRRMAEGGMYDHLGGGFCRYSTDARWLIPHFEKMLYDNGPLLRLYAQGWQLTGDPLLRAGVRGNRRLADARDAVRRRRLLLQPRRRLARARKDVSTSGSAMRSRKRSARMSSPPSPRATGSTHRPTSRAARGTCTWPVRWPRLPTGSAAPKASALR